MNWKETPKQVKGTCKRRDVCFYEHQWDQDAGTMTWIIKFSPDQRGRTKKDFIWIENNVDFS